MKSPPPGDVELKFKALVQADGRFFIGDERFPQNDTFLFRRVEPTIEGSWGKLIGFRLNAQLAGDSATLNDAYVDLRFDPRATLRIGKTKTPLGLERLQSSASLAMVELGPDVALRMPAELSGGMVKRVALARALALEPELLLLDEPTAGLDPDRSAGFVRLIRGLHQALGLTVILVTHDLDTLAALATRVAVLSEGRILAFGSLEEIMRVQDPFIERFFHSERSQAALARGRGLG